MCVISGRPFHRSLSSTPHHHHHHITSTSNICESPTCSRPEVRAFLQNASQRDSSRLLTGSSSHNLTHMTHMQVATLQSLHAKLTGALSSIHQSAAPLYLDPLPRTNQGRSQALLKASHEAVQQASSGVLQVGADDFLKRSAFYFSLHADKSGERNQNRLQNWWLLWVHDTSCQTG